MADVADQSAETSSASDWLKKITDTVTAVYTADKTADAARDAARAAAARNTTTTTQPNWTLIGAVAGGAVLLLVLVFAFKK